MKSIIQTALIAAACAAPAFAFAQSDSTVTRAQVRADLVQMEKAGYHPGDDDVHYPVAAQAAEARVAAQDDAAGGYGGAVSGQTQSGGSYVSAAAWRSMYEH